LVPPVLSLHIHHTLPLGPLCSSNSVHRELPICCATICLEGGSRPADWSTHGAATKASPPITPLVSAVAWWPSNCSTCACLHVSLCKAASLPPRSPRRGRNVSLTVARARYPLGHRCVRWGTAGLTRPAPGKAPPASRPTPGGAPPASRPAPGGAPLASRPAPGGAPRLPIRRADSPYMSPACCQQSLQNVFFGSGAAMEVPPLY